MSSTYYFSQPSLIITEVYLMVQLTQTDITIDLHGCPFLLQPSLHFSACAQKSCHTSLYIIKRDTRKPLPTSSDHRLHVFHLTQNHNQKTQNAEGTKPSSIIYTRGQHHTLSISKPKCTYEIPLQCT